MTASTPTLEAERAAPELLPCAHCGAPGMIKRGRTVMVSCTACTASTFQLLDDEESAIAAWNRRATAAEGVALPPLLEPKYPQMKVLEHGERSVQCGYTAEQVRQAQRDAYEAGSKSGRVYQRKVDEKIIKRRCTPPAQSIGDDEQFKRLLNRVTERRVDRYISGDRQDTVMRYKEGCAALIAYIDARTAGAAPEVKPVAWARKWHIDGEKPEKRRNANGRMAWPGKFRIFPVTPNKAFPDDVPLIAAAPAPTSTTEEGNAKGN